MRFSSRARSPASASTSRRNLSISLGRARSGCSSVQYSARFSASRCRASPCHVARALPPEARRCATTSPNTLERSSSKSQPSLRKSSSTAPARSAGPSISIWLRARSARAEQGQGAGLELDEERARGVAAGLLEPAAICDSQAQLGERRTANLDALAREGAKPLRSPGVLRQKMVQSGDRASLEHGAAGSRARSVRLLYSREQPARGAAHRLAEIPDLLERLGRRACVLADRAGKPHARPIQIAF